MTREEQTIQESIKKYPRFPERMKLWIARDKDKSLFLYLNKPIINDDTFTVNWDEPHWWDAQLTNDMFSEVTFENSPQQVEIKLIKEDKI